jgi:hypothetical protein
MVVQTATLKYQEFSSTTFAQNMHDQVFMVADIEISSNIVEI